MQGSESAHAHRLVSGLVSSALECEAKRKKLDELWPGTP